MPNKDGGWVLPDVINPTRRCFQIEIPDDFHHRAAFFGALYELTRWYNWQADDAHTAKDVAAVWKDIWRAANNQFYSGGGSCEMQTQLRMNTSCGTLQVSYDGGIQWLDVVDIGSCINAGVSAGIGQALSDGTIGAPSQQPAGGTLPPSECHTYNISLNANNRWQSPIPVSAGYTVTVTNAKGAWSGDNAILSIWACVDGKQFSIGACGSALPGIPGDPIPGLSHMRLIGYCNTVYMDMYNTTYTVPVGTPDSSFFLQCNDSDIMNNQGSVTLTVTICNTAANNVLVEQACDPNGCNGTGPFGTLYLNTPYVFNSTHSTYYCPQERMDLYFHSAVDITVAWPQGHGVGCANWSWYAATNASSNQTNSWTGISYGGDLRTTFQGIKGIVFAGPNGVPFGMTITVTAVYQ